MQRTIRIASVLLALLLGGVWALALFGRAPGESVADAFLRRIAALTGAAAEAGVPVMEMASGAGHDSQQMAAVCPVRRFRTYTPTSP